MNTKSSFRKISHQVAVYYALRLSSRLFSLTIPLRDAFRIGVSQ